MSFVMNVVSLRIQPCIAFYVVVTPNSKIVHQRSRMFDNQEKVPNILGLSLTEQE